MFKNIEAKVKELKQQARRTRLEAKNAKDAGATIVPGNETELATDLTAQTKD